MDEFDYIKDTVYTKEEVIAFILADRKKREETQRQVTPAPQRQTEYITGRKLYD